MTSAGAFLYVAPSVAAQGGAAPLAIKSRPRARPHRCRPPRGSPPSPLARQVVAPWTPRFRSTWAGSPRTCRSAASRSRASSQLLDEGNTVPFITRYRKERTGNLDETAIREVQRRVGRLRELAERKETVLRSIEAQGKLTEELAEAIRRADTPQRLEDLYLPFKPKKKTKASDAREKGLEPLALRIWNRDETLTDLRAAAEAFVDPSKGVENVDQVLEGVGHILAESISELATVRDAVRRVVWRLGRVVHPQGRQPARGAGGQVRRLLRLLRARRPRPAAPRPGDQPRRQGRPAEGQARGPPRGPRADDPAPAPAGRAPPVRDLHRRGLRRPGPPPAAEHRARGPPRADRAGRAARRRGLRPQPPQPAAPAADHQADGPGRSTPASGPAARSPCSTPTARSRSTASSS